MSSIFSIGYQGYQMNEFVNVLHKYDISILVDVRSVPYSKIHCWNKENLKQALKSEGIYYVNFGSRFGARPDNPNLYRNGRADFELMSKADQFLIGCEQILKSKGTLCLMCMEEQPSMCHRTILCVRALYERGMDVSHIINKGKRTVDQEDVEMALVKFYFGVNADVDG